MLSLFGLVVGVAVGGVLEDQGGRRDLGLGRLQDRVLAGSGPGGERRAEVAVIGVLGRDRQALPVREPGGERAIFSSRSTAVVVIVRGRCPFRIPVLVSVRWGGNAPITAVSSASISAW